jgi:hypothetical protein
VLEATKTDGSSRSPGLFYNAPTAERLRRLTGDNVPGTAKTNTVAERRRKNPAHPFALIGDKTRRLADFSLSKTKPTLDTVKNSKFSNTQLHCLKVNPSESSLSRGVGVPRSSTSKSLPVRTTFPLSQLSTQPLSTSERSPAPQKLIAQQQFMSQRWQIYLLASAPSCVL